MKKFFLFLLGATLIVVPSIYKYSSTGKEVSADCSPNIMICHATDSHTNPYNAINADRSADVAGHDGHNGGIYPADPWGDIIPQFDYQVWEVVGSHMELDEPAHWDCPVGWQLDNNICTHGQETQPAVWMEATFKKVDDNGWREYIYPGKNWTLEGQIIWNNDCILSGSAGSVTPTPTPDPSCDPCASPTPTLTATPSPTLTTGAGGDDDGGGGIVGPTLKPTATPTPTPTPTSAPSTSDSSTSDEGSSSSSDSGQGGISGEVLGTSTLGATGTSLNYIYEVILLAGMTLSGIGVKKFTSKD